MNVEIRFSYRVPRVLVLTQRHNKEVFSNDIITNPLPFLGMGRIIKLQRFVIIKTERRKIIKKNEKWMKKKEMASQSQMEQKKRSKIIKSFLWHS